MKNARNAVAARWGGLAWALGLLLALAGRPALAQTLPTNPNGQTANPAAPIVRPDTATVRKVSKKEKRALAAADSARRTEKLFGFRVTKPTKAGLFAILPGGGQIYNHKYWKLPLVYGLVGGLGYWVFYQERYYSAFKFANNNDTTAIRQTSQIHDSILRSQLIATKINNPTAITNGLINARRYRDLSILLSAVGYSLTVLDAVVDAHLSEFDVSDDLSLRWQPAAVPVPGQAAFAPGLLLTLRTRR